MADIDSLKAEKAQIDTDINTMLQSLAGIGETLATVTQTIADISTKVARKDEINKELITAILS